MEGLCATSMKPFPTDETTLSMLEVAMQSYFTCDEEGNHELHGEFQMATLLEFLSGPSNYSNIDDDERFVFRHEPMYSEHDVIQALIDEIRRLRAATPDVRQGFQGNPDSVDLA